MRIGIVGSRRRNSLEDYHKVLAKLEELYKEGDIIVSGGCYKGADNFAERIAKEKEIPIIIYYARWKRHGKAAGFIRNTDIAEQSDILIACVSPDRKGGTEDTIKKYLKNKNKLHLV